VNGCAAQDEYDPHRTIVFDAAAVELAALAASNAACYFALSSAHRPARTPSGPRARSTCRQQAY
jgi:hypothetical protein